MYTTSAIVVAAIAFGFMHEIELKQDVPCEIVSPSEVKIRGLTGLVSAIYVHPSQRVEAGSPLFRLERDLSLSADGRRRDEFDEQMRDAQIRAIDAQYGERRIQLNAQRQGALVTAASRRAELGALDEQIAQNRLITGESEKRLSRLESVTDYVTADKIEQARAEVLQSKVSSAQGVARRQQLEGEVGTSQSTQAAIDAQLRELDAQHARDVQDVRTRFEQARQAATVSAPQAGVVTFSSLVAGRVLDKSEVPLVIATDDKGPLRAALLIPSRRRGFVREGQTVRLKFDAFPYVKFGTYEARIDAISGTTVSSMNSDDKDKTTTDGDYMAWATLRGKTFDFEGQHFAILPGMRATASVVVERRTIAQWVLAPLFRVLRG
ncbi:secretion protein HlyD family protein [Caballeronia cordobensis]|uniref:Secretion protein HlyD family protein n=2 Tax=Caballeronia cordobensis TaxID=1353886 RepID=A0A158HTB7_CABCO|nr:secretion protein HlyD family protein [Caballeronia cordobensis]